jgi:hypothetical protein
MVQGLMFTSIMGSSIEEKRKNGEDGENAELMHVRLACESRARQFDFFILKEYLYSKK